MATIEDLYHVEGRAELVKGQIRRIPLHGHLHGMAEGALFCSLRDHSKKTGVGRPFTGGVAFVVNLPNRQSFSPDIAYYVGPHFDFKFPEGAPVFAAEIRNRNEYSPAAEKKMAEKRREYSSAGTQVVWDVDILKDKLVRVYRASDPENPTVYRSGEIAEAEPAVPGWTFPVDDLFDD